MISLRRPRDFQTASVHVIDTHDIVRPDLTPVPLFPLRQRLETVDLVIVEQIVHPGRRERRCRLLDREDVCKWELVQHVYTVYLGVSNKLLQKLH